MKMKLFFVIASIFLLGQGEARAFIPDEVSIDGQAVVMPIGRILLISRDNFIGAVKFLHNEERKDGLYSKYQYFEYENGTFRKIGEGVLFLKIPQKSFWYNLRSFFFHDIPSSFADKISFKSFEIYSNASDEFHSTVCFWDAAANPDVKVRLAPTPWMDILEVNLKDKKIRWFKHDKNRKQMIIHIDKLWEFGLLPIS